MTKFTGKKVIKNKKEFTTLISNLKKDGYTWGSGDNLTKSADTINLQNHLPVLLVFDAKNKKVYYSPYIDYEVEIDPTWV